MACAERVKLTAGVKLAKSVIQLAGILLVVGAVGCQTLQDSGLRMVLADATEPPPRGEPGNLTWTLGGSERTSWIQSVAVNETVGLQMHLSVLAGPLGPVDVQVADFVGFGAPVPSQQVARLYRVEPVTVTQYDAWAPTHLGTPLEPRTVPDVLIPWDAPRGGGPVTVNQTGVDLWLDFTMPPTASPGRYTSSLQLVVNDQVIDTVELVLQVLPVAIPAERRLALLAPLDVNELLMRELGWSRRQALAFQVSSEATEPSPAERVVHAALKLLHEHRIEPLLEGLEPRFKLAGAEAIEIDWATHDALLGGLLSGQGDAAGVPSRYWLLPASSAYPSLQQHGGVHSARYAKVLIGYLKACLAHLEEQGWRAQPLVRFEPPTELSDGLRARLARLNDIVRLSELDVRTVTHLPPESLTPLGWEAGKTIKPNGVGAWAPPAQWITRSGIQAASSLGQDVWMLPDEPPYAASLSAAGLPTDPRSLGWQAFRYGLTGIWLEGRDGSDAPLFTSGKAYGVEGPLPTVRLKRLQRAELDYELLSLLEDNGQGATADGLAQQILPYGFTDACGAHLLNTLPASWPAQGAAYERARYTALAALAEGSQVTAARGARADDRSLIHTAVEGVRLAQGDAGLVATVQVSAVNRLSSSLSGTWTVQPLPPSWGEVEAVPMQTPAGAQRLSTIALPVQRLTLSPDGVLPIAVSLKAPVLNERTVPGRLAATVAPLIPTPIAVDGRLGDWPTGAQNTASNFQLVRFKGDDRQPTLATTARFAFDEQYFYVAIEAQLSAGERPMWQATNLFPVDGAIPWQQDVLEVILSPDNALDGGPDVLRLVRIKPSGLVATYEGCPTRPQIGAMERWDVDARVAVSLGREAWTVELALPLEALRLRESVQPVWGVNVARLDARRGEYSSWSGAVGDCYRPIALGNLLFQAPQ